jgi:peptidoglycan/xylan/chitin deacetylase (PgdA/CDA1 family)
MKEFIFKTLYRLGVPRLLRISKKNTITVLNLHRITEERDYFYNPIKPQTFYNLIDYCLKNYDIIPFSDIHKPSIKPKLILSFDDGYRDFIEYVLPYLIKQGIPSNHNVVNECINNNIPIWTQRLNDVFNELKLNSITNEPIISCKSEYKGSWMLYYLGYFHYLITIEKEERNRVLNELITKYNVKSSCKMMNWTDLKYCIKNGVEIGSHSYTHDSIATIKNNSGYEKEILASVEEISSRLNEKVSIFALPNGQYNSNVVEYIKTIGIQHLLIVDERVNKCNLLSNNSFNLISRISLSDSSIYESILKTELFHSKIKNNI